MDSLTCFAELDDLTPTFEFAPRLLTPCQLPSKPREQPPPQQQIQCQQLNDKSVDHRLQYPDDIPGPIGFSISVNAGDAPSVCVYSKKLKRIYTSMNQALRISFNWKPTSQPLFLRSAVVFTEDYHMTEPVKRCYAHRGSELAHNIGVSHDQLSYVFRVSQPVNAYETIYEPDICGIFTSKTMFTRTDLGTAWLDFRFFCQNSCATGINRRSTKMLFLLEDAMGVVIAKRSVLIQICANPKRDKERDENRATESKAESKKAKKKKPTPTSQPPAIVQNGNDDESAVYALNIDILGEENYKKVLDYAYTLMASQAIRTGNHQLLKPHMDAILAKENEKI